MNSQKKITSQDQQNLSSWTYLHVPKSKYGQFQGIDLFAYLQRVACEALMEYTYIKHPGDKPESSKES